MLNVGQTNWLDKTELQIGVVNVGDMDRHKSSDKSAGHAAFVTAYLYPIRLDGGRGEVVKEGDTIVILEDYPEEGWYEGDHLVVDEVDEDGCVWIRARNDDDTIGFDPDEYRLPVARVSQTSLIGADVETSQRNRTNDNLRSIFG
jgi:hypothetical protein